MNICIYTVHLLLYECITCKVVWSVTVHSVSTVLPDVNYGNSLDDSYCTEIQKAALLMYAIFLFKSTNLHITVCGILIERDCFKMFELLRIWSISQFLAAPFSHCKAMIDNIISSDMHLCPWPLLPLPLFCLCTLPCTLTPLLPLSCWPWSFSGCSSIVRVCNFLLLSSVYICFSIEGSWNAPLSYFKELVYNWLIYILFISESQDSLAQFMANLQKV